MNFNDFMMSVDGDIMYTGNNDHNPDNMSVQDFYRYLTSTYMDMEKKKKQDDDLTEENAEEMFLDRIGA